MTCCKRDLAIVEHKFGGWPAVELVVPCKVGKCPPAGEDIGGRLCFHGRIWLAAKQAKPASLQRRGLLDLPLSPNLLRAGEFEDIFKRVRG
jgi:hypothetical protein